MPPENEQQLDARTRLSESLWNDPETRPEMERIVKKKFPNAPIASHDLRVEGERILSEVRKERAAFADERKAVRQEDHLREARETLLADPELHVRPEEIPAIEKLMQEELIGSHRAAARLYRAQQTVATGRTEPPGGPLSVPGLNGAGGDEFKWLVPALGGDKSVLDSVTRTKAHEIISDFRNGRGDRWL
jgi:hypothetical protein